MILRSFGCIVQEPSYLDKYHYGLDCYQPKHNYSGIQKISHFDIPTKYQYLIGITILVPTGRFFNTIIDVDY